MSKSTKSPQTQNIPTLTGAEILWATLVGEGVTTVFGYPGGAILPAYDALRKFPIHHVLVRHEQGAAHMADGYARASGKLVSCNVHVAPGLGNAIGSIYTSFVSGTPMIVLSWVMTGSYWPDSPARKPQKWSKPQEFGQRSNGPAAPCT